MPKGSGRRLRRRSRFSPSGDFSFAERVDLNASSHARSTTTSNRALDVALLLVVLVWAANFSLIKVALRDTPLLTFNSVRLLVAALCFVAFLWREHAAREQRGLPSVLALTAPEWRRVVLLGLVGGFFYQLLFLPGAAKTTVANASLLVGCTPVVVALLATVSGHERMPLLRWGGVLLSLAGIYLLVGGRAELSSSTAAGDLLIVGSVLCWSVYTVSSAPLLARHSPAVVTGLTMLVGTAPYVLVSIPAMASTSWSGISALSWVLTIVSGLASLSFAYLIWYRAIRALGPSRTAIYANLTPIVAMAIAAVWIGERVGWTEIGGAAAILSGVLITRLTPVSTQPR